MTLMLWIFKAQLLLIMSFALTGLAIDAWKYLKTRFESGDWHVHPKHSPMIPGAA